MLNKFLNGDNNNNTNTGNSNGNNNLLINKLKDLVGYCNKKYGHIEFSSKINLS
jgi:hypothetical protein